MRPFAPAASLSTPYSASRSALVSVPRSSLSLSRANGRPARLPHRLLVPQIAYPNSRGLGVLTGQTGAIAATAQAGAAAVTSTLVALGTIGGPVGAAIAGMISLAGVIANMFSGCGQTCVEASDIANQVGDYLEQMLDTYMAAPVHYASMQAAYIQNFNSAWNSLVQACSNPQLQAAGQRCVTDRQRGACTWKASQGGWQGNTYVPWGPSGSGSACWNWFVGYLDPVANDPTVVPDPSPVTAAGSAIATDVSSAVSSLTSALPATVGGFPTSELLIFGGALLLAALFL